MVACMQAQLLSTRHKSVVKYLTVGTDQNHFAQLQCIPLTCRIASQKQSRIWNEFSFMPNIRLGLN